MIILEFAIILLSIYLGLRFGGMAIGLMGGLALGVLSTFFSITPTQPPIHVILIIFSVVIASSALQAAKGLDYLVMLATEFIKRRPQQINYYAPLTCYVFTLFSGTGHIIYSLLPIIAEVSQKAKIRCEYPLSLSVIASQQAINGSPLSAATLILAGILSQFDYEIFSIISISIPSTIFGVLLAAYIVPKVGKNKDKIPYFPIEDRMEERNLSAKKNTSAKRSVLIFAIGVVVIILLSLLQSFLSSEYIPTYLKNLTASKQVPVVMFSTAALILMFCKVPVKSIVKQKTFDTGIQAIIAILGLAWLGDSFISAHKEELFNANLSWFKEFPLGFAVIAFLSSIFLFSQSVTTQTLFPLGVSLGIDPSLLLAFYPSVNGYFVIPNYPTIIAAINADKTNSTQVGSFFINHSFLLPGFIATFGAITFGLLIRYLLKII